MKEASHLHEVPKIVIVTEAESRTAAARGWAGDWGVAIQQVHSSVMQDELVMESC